MRNNKKLIACMLSSITVLFGVIAMPTQANAAGNTITVQSEIQYEETAYETFSGMCGKTAPTKEGYLFGGWYKDANGTTCVSKTEDVQASEKVYAKFVPAQVLSVKAQNYSTTTEASEKTTTRMISSIDCRSYQNVGFEIVNMETGKTITSDPINTVYEKLAVFSGEKREEYTSKQIFGEIANATEQNFIVLSLKNIPQAKWDTDIYVRPFWTTHDGVRVYGLGKYVYVNDGVKGWASIPVNLHTGANVAGGMISVTVPEGLQYQGCRAGRVFTEITANKNGNVIKCVGHTPDGSDVAADDLFAVLRFKIEGNYQVGNGSFLNFTVKDLGFADNAENLVKMNIMNVQY